ncbi:MAG: hypothetical protein JKX94_10110, partial [Sneathiella sp.]|nr:hypothetical protein [Sneathiella sp.]
MIKRQAITKLIVALGFLLFLNTGINSVQAADKVIIRAAEHPTYGRLVMDWGVKQQYDAKISDGFLVVQFRTPFEADLKKAS